MTVSERKMGIGSWQLNFNRRVPRSLLDMLDTTTSVGFGHVIITRTRVDPNAITEADLLANASYAGVFREHPTEFTIGGPGLAVWLADEEDKGNIYETAKTGGAQTFAAWIADLRPAALTAGTVTAIGGGTFPQQFYLATPRQAIDTVCDYFGGEWKITPDFKLHAGPQANLFVTTPKVIVQRNDNGRDLNVTGIHGQFDTESDLDDYTTRTIVITRGVSGEAAIGAANTPVTIPYKDPQGNALVMKRLIDGSQVDAGNGNAVAATQVGRFDDVRRSITLSSDVYDVTGDITVGDTIWVYDPLLNLVDTSNEVIYRGRTIHPIAIRVLGYTWPIRRGMGVYLRYYNGAGVTYLDLTDYVAWETQDAQIEVGATPRSSDGTDPSSAQATAATPSQLADKWGHKNGTTDANGDITVTYATAFPTATDNVVVTVLDGLGGLAVHTQVWSLAAGSFKVRCYTAVGAGSPGYANSGIDFFWQAKGH